MALQSSGAISLSQIQSEWGGSNPISLSEYYLGSLPTGRTNYGSIPSSGAIDFADFYGTNSALANWTTTVTIGSFTIVKQQIYGFSNYTISYGSISDNTIDTYANRVVRTLSWGGTTFSFIVNGAPNSGWTRIIVHNTSFYRSQASYQSTGGVAIWTWAQTTNPWAATSGTRTVTFIV